MIARQHNEIVGITHQLGSRPLGWPIGPMKQLVEPIAQAKRALELDPHLGEATACMALAEQSQGKQGPEMFEFHRRVLERGGQTSLYNRSLAYGVLGRDEEAMRALQSAFEEREIQMPLAKTEPAFAALHQDSRFHEMMRKMGLE